MVLTSAMPVRGDVLTFVTTNLTTFNIGTLSGQNGQLLHATNAVNFTQLSSGAVLVGSGTGGDAGGGGNAVVLSNALLTTTAASFLGGGSSNNTLTLLPTTSWNAGNFGLSVGRGAAVGNTLIVNGALIHNLGALNIGTLTGGAGSNQVLVDNGGVISNVTALRVGSRAGANFNSLVVTNGRFVMTSAGTIVVGAEAIPGSGAGGSGNTVILSNSVLLGGAPLGSLIGWNSSSNTVTLLADTFWSNDNRDLYVGWLNPTGAANSNSLIVRGAILTNFSKLIIGGVGGSSAGSVSSNGVFLSEGGRLFVNDGGLEVGSGPGGSFNSLVATNDGRFVLNSGRILVGAGATTPGTTVGGGNNTVTLSNSLLTTSLASFLGVGSSNNTMTLLPATSWNAGNAGVAVGINAAVGNELLVHGGGITNLGAFAIGRGTGASSNRVVVDNGGVLSNVSSLLVGSTPGANHNRLIVTNGGLFMTSAGTIGFGGNTPSGAGQGGSHNTVILSNSVLQAGAPGVSWSMIGWNSSSNSVTLLPNTRWNNGNLILYIGWSNPTVLVQSNTLTVSGAVITNVSQLLLGGAIGVVSNSLLINNGGQVFVGNSGVQLGTVNANHNSLRVSEGGLLEVNTLQISGGTGNTISNVNGSYQFTQATPTITPLVAGNIAITDGTISFRGVNSVNVSNSLIGGSSIGNIRFAGANTLVFNGSSNTTATGQNYTFQQIPGNPSNYVNLVMVNGATAYRGGNLTIGATGSLLISNTTATVSGLLTNTGSLSVVNAYATYQSRVYNGGTHQMLHSVGTFQGGVINAGHWLTDPTTNIFAGFGMTNTTSGIISLTSGDVYVFTNTSSGTPASFINVSTNKLGNDMLAGKFVFTGGLGLTQTLAVAGHNFETAATATNIAATTPAALGFVNNFALGTLELSNFSTVRVTDAFLEIGTNDFLMAGLYLENLFLGVNSLLIIDTNVQVYFRNSNDWSLANIRLVNNQGLFGDAHTYNNLISGLHQLDESLVIPEPSVLLLCTAGFALLYFSQRRSRRLKGTTK